MHLQIQNLASTASMSAKVNNFDIIRLLAAVVVIVNHGYGFAGLEDPLRSITHQVTWGREGVYIFFLISGYLITKSWLRSPNLRVYFANRILRIFPGLIAVVTVSIFLIGPVFTQLSLHDYFLNPATYKYFSNISLIKLCNSLPQTFLIKGHENVTNAPLWTLVFEFMMYIFVAIFGLLGLLNPKKYWFGIFIAIYVFFLIYTSTNISPQFVLLKINVRCFCEFYLYYFTGALFFFFQDKIKLRWWYILPMTVLWYFSIDTSFYVAANLLLTTLIVFYISFMPWRFGTFITKHGDFSYGMYLYGYLVQNMVNAKFGYSNVYLSTLLCIALTIPFAAFSWYAIESRALKFKVKAAA